MGNFRFGHLALLGSVLVLLAGCSAPLPRFVWPPPPEQPRFEWVGNYYSEDSMKKGSVEELAKLFAGDPEEKGFTSPFGIVAFDGRVYVSDVFAQNVRVFDFNKKKVELLTKDGRVGRPFGLGIDSEGRLYVADGASKKIFIYKDQNLVRVIEDEEHLEKPAYFAISPDLQRLYVSDGLKNAIAVFSLEGEFLFSIGQRGNADGELYAPQGLAFGPDGNLYVCDMYNARIQVFTPDGVFVSKFGTRGDQASQFENPKDLAFDSEGHLYVVDARRSDLFVFKPDGTLLLNLGEGRPSRSQFAFSAPKSVFIDKDDRIYVAEYLGRRFSVWQYMSKSYLREHPYTEADKRALDAYMQKLRRQSVKTDQ